MLIMSISMSIVDSLWTYHVILLYISYNFNPFCISLICWNVDSHCCFTELSSIWTTTGERLLKQALDLSPGVWDNGDATANSQQACADAAVAVVGPGVVAKRRPDTVGVTVKAATSYDTVGVRIGSWGIYTRRNTIVTGFIPIITPFPHITMHII